MFVLLKPGHFRGRAIQSHKLITNRTTSDSKWRSSTIPLSKITKTTHRPAGAPPFHGERPDRCLLFTAPSRRGSISRTSSPPTIERPRHAVNTFSATFFAAVSSRADIEFPRSQRGKTPALYSFPRRGRKMILKLFSSPAPRGLAGRKPREPGFAARPGDRSRDTVTDAGCARRWTGSGRRDGSTNSRSASH